VNILLVAGFFAAGAVIFYVFTVNDWGDVFAAALTLFAVLGLAGLFGIKANAQAGEPFSRILELVKDLAGWIGVAAAVAGVVIGKAIGAQQRAK
jgi:hypothetical protein